MIGVLCNVIVNISLTYVCRSDDVVDLKSVDIKSKLKTLCTDCRQRILSSWLFFDNSWLTRHDGSDRSKFSRSVMVLAEFVFKCKLHWRFSYEAGILFVLVRTVDCKFDGCSRLHNILKISVN